MYILIKTENALRVGRSQKSGEPGETWSGFSTVSDFDWEDALLADRTRQHEGEQRYAALGIYTGKVHTVVFTKRGLKIRVTSWRRSNRAEKRAYESAKGKNETKS